MPVCRSDLFFEPDEKENQRGEYKAMNYERFKRKMAEQILEFLPEEKKKRIIDSALKAIDPYSMERFYQNAKEVYTRVWKSNW